MFCVHCTVSKCIVKIKKNNTRWLRDRRKRPGTLIRDYELSTLGFKRILIRVLHTVIGYRNRIWIL